MYHVLTIQLHYPVTTRTRHVAAPEADLKESFEICSKAAKQIVLMLTAYNRMFSILKAPYLIAYATYVSATVHVRDASRQPSTSDTLVYLRTCLSLMDKNKETNPGVENAKASLTSLMNRLGVVVQIDQIPFSNPAESEFPAHSRSPSTQALAAFWAAPPLTMESPEAARVAAMDPMVDIHGPIDPHPETERYFQEYAETQCGVPHIDPLMPPQYSNAGYSIPLDFGDQSAVESLLLDPTGIEYQTTGGVPSDQLDMNSAMSDYTWAEGI